MCSIINNFNFWIRKSFANAYSTRKLAAQSRMRSLAGSNNDRSGSSLTCMECCERNDLIEPVGCKDGTLPPKLMAEFLHPAGVDHPPRTLAVVHPIPTPQSSTSIFKADGHAAFYVSDIARRRRLPRFARCNLFMSRYPC